MNLRDKRFVITGASDGIGRELAIQLAREGAKLVLAARSLEKLNDVCGMCEEAGSAATPVVTDVSKESDCANLIANAAAALGGIDVLVNNAGISYMKRLEDCDDLYPYETVMAVNYLGAVYCTHHALPHLKASRGLLVAVSSGQGKTGFPGFSAYSASKFAMHGFFDSLRIELEDDSVDVQIVCPGPVQTAIHNKSLGEARPRKLGGRASKMNMPVEECAARMVKAIKRRDREVMLMQGGTIMQWIKLVAPGVVDRAIAKALGGYYKDSP